MSATTDRAAEIMLDAYESNRQAGTLTAYPYQVLAQALADAGSLTTPERDDEQRRAGAAEALRRAAQQTVWDPALADVVTWLRERADRIEEQR